MVRQPPIAAAPALRAGARQRLRASRRRGRGLLLAAALVLPASPALACSDPPEPAEYVIRHETYGDVGRHAITFACEGDDLVVETAIAGESGSSWCRCSSATAATARSGALGA